MTIHFKRKKVYTCNGFVCIKSLSTEFQIGPLDYLTTHTSLSPIQCGGPWWLNELGSWIT